MSHDWTSLAVFALCYLFFVILPTRRSWTACIGAVILVVAGVLPWRDALIDKINWNVMGLFLGTLVLAELFILSRAPAVLAEWLVDRTRTARGAMLVLCALSGGISIFVENVAVVLLIAPVALSLAEKLRINPVPLLVGIAVSSNLQGTATMIGDPPSMILAGYMHLGFWDFFAYHGRPGIFFAVQIGAVAALLVMGLLFRRHRERTSILVQEHIRSWTPSVLLVLLVVGLSFATAFDPGFKWFAGVYTLSLALIALLWFRIAARWGSVRELCKALDWDTTFFLIGVFVVVGTLSDSGWMDRMAGALAGSFGDSRFAAFGTIMLLAVGVSGFVDNVPFLLVMIPVAQKIADQMQAPVPLLMFGLLIGACLGGNLTPIGASANVVTIGILRKQGHALGFREFMKIGVPVTIAAVLVASLFVWWVWN